jgi:hypothetical protein
VLINSPKTNKVSPKTSTRVKAVIKKLTNDNNGFVGLIRGLEGFKIRDSVFYNKFQFPKKPK